MASIACEYNSGADVKGALAAQAFTKSEDSSYRYLVYEDVRRVFAELPPPPPPPSQRVVVDYGAGTGISLAFLHSVPALRGADFVGLDHDPSMIAVAQQHLAAKGLAARLLRVDDACPSPVAAGSADVVFSSFVLFEMPTLAALDAYMAEAARMLAPGRGLFVAVTGSEQAYDRSRSWLHLNVDYEQNDNLYSGKPVCSLNTDANILFKDYYWTEADYAAVAQRAGLEIVEIRRPLGRDTDPFPWRDEKTVAPFIVIVARKQAP